ncbi:MAG: Ig-like domain-containing protein [Thermoplasmatota archaeon]
MSFGRSVASGRILVMAILLILSASTLILMKNNDVVADEVIGTQDAWIIGKVVNGEAGMKVSCLSMKNLPPPQLPTQLTFTGTTDASGNFNITVDSNAWGSPPDINPYSVLVNSSYYKEMISGNNIHTFTEWIFPGNVTQVPPGTLIARDYATSNLTVKILNRTSGEPLPGARVEIGYKQNIPTPPFPLAKATNSSGEVYYPKVRSINTSIEATRANFRPLSDTEPDDYTIVDEGGESSTVFELVEKSWPFTVLVGSEDVNHSQPIRIDFRRTMDHASILKTGNYGLWKGEGMVPVPFKLTSRDSDRMVDLEPIDDLDFNTSYIIRIEPYLLDEGAMRPLWRAMTVTFKTELPPGSITGRLVNAKTLAPAEGLFVRVLDQLSITDVNGIFDFPVVPAGTYRLDVDESYLFNSTTMPGTKVEKGESLDLGDIPIGPKKWGSLKVKVFSDGTPLEGAWVQVVDDLIREEKMNLTTDKAGEVLFQYVVAGVVTVDASAPHHNRRGDMALVPESGQGYLEIDLIEDTLPVWVEAVNKNPDGTVAPGSNFLVHLPEAVKFSSLNVTIWSTDDDGIASSKVPLSIEAGQDELTYIVNPDTQLPMEKPYVLIVSQELLSLDDSSQLLWRDLQFFFRTPDLPMVHIDGTLLFEGKVIQGYSVGFGSFLATTDAEGYFNISIDPETAMVSSTFSANGSQYGYGTFDLQLELDAGDVRHLGTIDLFHIPGWYTVVPAPGEVNVDPSAVIIFTFKEPIIVPNEDRFNRLLSVVPEGLSAPVAGEYVIGSENRTVTFTPGSLLEPNTVYNIRISKDLMRWDNVSMFPLGNSTNFKVKPPAITVEVLEPSDPQGIPIDSSIRLAFSYDVEKEMVEDSIEFLPDVEGIRFGWTSGSEVRIWAYFQVSTEYQLKVRAGIHGIDGEPLPADFSYNFTTGTGYGLDHDIGSPQIFPAPENGWKLGENIRFSGVVSDSAGYEINIRVTKDGSVEREATTTVSADGTWNLNISAPDEEGSYTLVVEIAMPGGPVADDATFDVEVSKEGASTPDDGNTTLIVIIVIIIVVIAVIIFAAVYARNQRAKADKELSEIDYTEVEGDWEDDDEEMEF